MKIIVALVGIIVIGGIVVFLGQENKESDITNTMKEHQDKIASYEISPGEVVKKVESNADTVLLDVRTPQEYEELHLQNALLLPVQELSQASLTAIGLGEDAKDTEIIIYCRSGSRSKTAYDIMKSLGYTNIKSVAGGMIHWEEDNYPLTEIGPYNSSQTGADQKDTSVSLDGPRISFDATSYDFGVIPQYGGVVQKDFTVRNEGNETLRVGDITTSCSCTSATISNTEIEPGENAVLSVVFDPDFHAEPQDVFKRTVFIPTNDQKTPEAEVTIVVDIAEGE